MERKGLARNQKRNIVGRKKGLETLYSLTFIKWKLC
jgi:hypothetical protein